MCTAHHWLLPPGGEAGAWTCKVCGATKEHPREPLDWRARWAGARDRGRLAQLDAERRRREDAWGAG